jgi:hypothetical protein
LFVRDPKERTLSAYLDKALRGKGQYVTKHCCIGESCGEEAHHSFLGFLNVIQTKCCCDPHWGPQSHRVDDAFRPYVNFVGHFENIQHDTKRLLRSVSSNSLQGDLWTKFGLNGWGPYRNESIFSKGTHATHQTSAMTKLKRYYNSTVERLVENIYEEDYNDPLLNFTRVKLF